MTQQETDKRMNKMLFDTARVFRAARASPVEMVMVCTLILERALANMPRGLARKLVETLEKVRAGNVDDARS